ncbi:MAG: hypothetical protein A2268_14545 [Candidatus Raymondbacteria bacterium RifOxyA12_full_50_37]|uniref:Porin domain-containing protein n=1 Tax=Candidatus Raymondbacteria bacterium RIFOXYD12_FULL_49_13 TaxID=1817890 RepID=A0A1F7F2E8_UNCRA|nr:MAG: hypothetical protein A2268_14545 [Candidatus Raymondbacteria bacterium RifOxyA12_full_50_37]OGJ88638.1 MAG: hypothetical protein A2248_20480 [Candidatus Raymondbacteria bacterium RIFOXYA2_FULL_49_16]OGJ90510.1 MAG: hypothetical protein A2350_18670 [Candidatus Raymondbacteria bacterium RifOxyB12_full_50_8]OGK00811.1 MAG: hypothetical protein A2519_07735 [Candidatus Raymondbacteria bacterium RIFOXYD12_FULL_49_13]OGP41674.1 MAG: hypothetical protein A2324_07565 [Candidatus Raymondbacteria 
MVFPAFFVFMLSFLFVSDGIAQSFQGGAVTQSKMNPAIAAVGEFEASASDDKSLAHPHQLRFLGGDLDIYAYVDPYFKAEMVICLHHKHAGFEEAYLESMTLPAGLKLRIGKFKAPFGKWNTVHGHALPVINMPACWERVFGEDGLNESGIAVSEMIPFLPTYHEIIGLALNGENQTAFNGAATRDLLYMGHLKNFFELGGYRTLEIGISHARGRNNNINSPRLYTNVTGANAIFQWKNSMLPLERAFTLWSEIYYNQRDTLDVDDVQKTHISTGYFILGKLQFLKRWYATCMYDYSGDPVNTGEIIRNVSTGVSFQPSEFSEIKLEYRRTMSDRSEQDPINELKAMVVFTIGAHGPHAF